MVDSGSDGCDDDSGSDGCDDDSGSVVHGNTRTPITNAKTLMGIRVALTCSAKQVCGHNWLWGGVTQIIPPPPKI